MNSILKSKSSLRAAILAGPIAALLGGTAHADSGTWTGGDGNWTDTTNWESGIVAQGIDQTATFNGVSAVTVTVDAELPIGSLSFSGANHTLNAGMLELSVTSGSPPITVDTGLNASIGTVLGGTEGFTKAGAGQLSLTGANTYTGATNINAGTLYLNQNFNGFNTSAFHGAVTVNSGATLTMDNSPVGWGGGLTALNVNAGTVNGNGGLGAFGVIYNLTGGSISGAGRMDLGTYNSVAGAINSAASPNTSTITKPAGILLRGDSGQTSYTFSVEKGTTSSGVDLQLPVIAENGSSCSVVKTGAGQLTLTATSTYSGGTTVNAGTLALGIDEASNENGNSLGSGVVTVTGGAQLRLGGAPGARVDYTIGNAITLDNGTIYGTDGYQHLSGGLTVAAGGGALYAKWGGKDISLEGAVTGPGTLAIDNGGVGLGSAAVHFTLGGTLGGLTGAGATDVSGGQTLAVGSNNADTAYYGTLSGGGGLTKSGTGTLTLTNNNTYTGATAVNGGILAVNSSITSSGSISIAAGATLNAGGNTLPHGNWTIAGTLNTTNWIQDISNPVTLNNGTISGGVYVPDWGTFNLFGPTITANGPANTINAALLGMLGGATIYTPNAGDALSISSILGTTNASGGGLTKTGNGTLTLTGANIYTGATTVRVGTLALVGGSQASPVSVSGGASLGFTLGSPTTSTSSFNLSAGTVKITGTPTSSSYTLITTSTGIAGTPTLATPIPGYALMVDGVSLKLVQSAGYAAWAATDAPTGSSADDYDGDGVSNGVEYVLGGSNLTDDLSKLPAVSNSGSDMAFTFRRARASIDGSTTVAIEVGTDLNTWPEIYNVGTNTAASTPGVTVEENTPTGFDTVTLTVPRGLDRKKFARLVVTPAP